MTTQYNLIPHRSRSTPNDGQIAAILPASPSRATRLSTAIPIRRRPVGSRATNHARRGIRSLPAGEMRTRETTTARRSHPRRWQIHPIRLHRRMREESRWWHLRYKPGRRMAEIVPPHPRGWRAGRNRGIHRRGRVDRGDARPTRVARRHRRIPSRGFRLLDSLRSLQTRDARDIANPLGVDLKSWIRLARGRTRRDIQHALQFRRSAGESRIHVRILHA
jgi:hypothetical protein